MRGAGSARALGQSRPRVASLCSETRVASSPALRFALEGPRPPPRSRTRLSEPRGPRTPSSRGVRVAPSEEQFSRQVFGRKTNERCPTAREDDAGFKCRVSTRRHGHRGSRARPARSGRRNHMPPAFRRQAGRASRGSGGWRSTAREPAGRASGERPAAVSLGSRAVGSEHRFLRVLPLMRCQSSWDPPSRPHLTLVTAPRTHPLMPATGNQGSNPGTWGDTRSGHDTRRLPSGDRAQPRTRDRG